MNKIALVYYYAVLQHLPSSYFPFGKLFNKLRILGLKNLIDLGENNRIQRSVYIGSGGNIKIGNCCQINENVKLDNVLISDHVMIAPGVTILGKMHRFNDLEIPMVLQGELETRQTVIEEDVWIGTNAIIMPGLRISKGSIIGAGSVLTKDTEPYGIYGGVPSRLIKFRIEEN